MSLNSNTVKIMICFAVGLVCGTVTKALLSSPQRQVASPAKALKWRPTEHNKTMAPIKVEIVKPETVPSDEASQVELTGIVHVRQAFGNSLDYTWNLPEGVSLMSGHMSESLPGISAGQTIKLQITVSGFNDITQKSISLSASTLAGDQRVGNSAIVVSRPQDTFEASAEMLHQEAEAQLGSSTTVAPIPAPSQQ